MEPAGESESSPGALGAAADSPHSSDSGAALGGARTRRRPASQQASEGGRRAGPGPSCPYDRAGRRRALPSHGKRRLQRRVGLAQGARRAARPLGLDSKGAPSAAGSPAAAAGSGCHPVFACGLPRGPGAVRLRPAAALQLLLGLRSFPGKGKAAHPIARRGTLSQPLARQRGLQPRAGAPRQLRSPCLSPS